MRLVSESAARVAGKSFQRKYIALGRIVSEWSAIVGESMAAKAQPVKINYRKAEKAKSAEARLDIAVSSAEATILHYQKDLILERINRIFGDKWITAIRFVSVPSEGLARRPPSRVEKPLTQDQETVLCDMLGGLEDEAFRQRLEAFGRRVFASSR